MDSGNSGSMQSSSGGDEEYDSRTEPSFSAFLNSSGHVGAMSTIPQPQPPPLSSHHHNPSSLDPLSTYLDVFSRSPPPSTANSLLNLDMVWPRSLRSEPNCTEIGALMGSSSSSQPIPGHQGSGRAPFPNPSDPENGARSSAPSDQTNVVRNSKKRSRASRRAPTTVLTTDTSNFRAMVQEFTGIPAPPFSASPFPRTRLDLFNPPPQPYLSRPFAQKFQPPSFVSSSSFSSSTMVDAIASTTNIACSTNTPTTTITSNSTTNNYQLPSELGLNMQSPILTFQSLLQSPPPTKYPLANVPIFGAKSSSQGPLSISSTDSHLRMGVLEEFNVNHGHVNSHLGGLPNLVNSDGISLRSQNNPSNWGDGVGSNDANQSHLRSFNGNNYGNSQRVSSCKMNISASSSDFNAEKGSENVSSRGEGMVDQWICSSD